MILCVDLDEVQSYDEMLKWTEEWLPVGADVDAKIEELAWLSVLLYGVAGWSANGDFNADFFT